MNFEELRTDCAVQIGKEIKYSFLSMGMLEEHRQNGIKNY